MSHHGDQPFEEMGRMQKIIRELKDTASFRGAIGSFPEGKLTASDEGAIQFAVGEKDGKVVIDFGTSTRWIGMSPQQAADLASVLLSTARAAGRRNGEMIHMKIG